MNNVCVVTGTRAEYHLLYPLIKRIYYEKDFNLQLVVTGSHLSEKFGNTYIDIESDGFPITYKIPILSDTDTISDINNAMSRMIVGFDVFLKNSNTDMIIILGDRYELLATACVAMNYRIPIAHIHGGERTEGAVDECIRHAITKMSYLHFTSCEEYKRRVIQLGEEPDRVFNVGSLGVENIKNVKRMTVEELSESLKFDLSGEFMVVTFHPVTLEHNTAKTQFEELLEALDCFDKYKIVFTKSNADTGGLQINQLIDKYVEKNSSRAIAVYSLGLRRYITAISLAEAVIGNSSSGIIETPSIPVATVNIGDRQKGRVQAKNIVNCIPERMEIKKAIELAISTEFKAKIKDTISPYGDGNTSDKIVRESRRFLESGIDLKKKFYDIDLT